jgi:hypothetical protein
MDVEGNMAQLPPPGLGEPRLPATAAPVRAALICTLFRANAQVRPLKNEGKRFADWLKMKATFC